MKGIGSVVLCLPVLAVLSATAQTPDAISRLAGDWKGDSICTAAAIGCRNEKVVWHVVRMPEKPGWVTVKGDRMENGKPVAMGALEFRYDEESRALVCEGPQGVWRVTVEENRIEGTLTRPDKTMFRRVSLRRG
ncbi:MAG TPA: hypothetical protein VGF59_07745 [Bryobacteraceae bacterium]|jgi:hypothetical protein